MSEGIGKETRSPFTLPCTKSVLGCLCGTDVGAREETLSSPHDSTLEVGYGQIAAGCMVKQKTGPVQLSGGGMMHPV